VWASRPSSGWALWLGKQVDWAEPDEHVETEEEACAMPLVSCGSAGRARTVVEGG
jgi:hypothetical protein